MKLKTYRLLFLSLTLFVVLYSSAPQAWATPPATTTALAVTSGGQAVTTVPAGSTVTLTATVKAGTTLITVGQVNFCDAAATYCTDIHLLGTAQLTSAGTAVFQFVPGGGSHSYKAVFPGATAGSTSSSVASNLVVNGSTTTTIAQSGGTGNYTLTATVAGSEGLVAPTGTVSFLDTSNGGTVLGTAALGTGTAVSSWTTQTPATKPDPQSIVAGDFNGDGIPDTAIGTNGTAATSGTGYLSILLGNGDGTFKAPTNFAAAANNQVIAAAAFVSGGPLDLIAVSNSTSPTNNANLFLGDGNGGGTLQAPFSLAVGSVSAIATGDFNRDGKQDFVVTGSLSSAFALAIYFGNGNGTFTSPTLIPLSVAPVSIAVGDFLGTGALDVAIAEIGVGGAAGTVSVFLNDGAGNFSQGVGGATGVGPTSMVTGDFNGDGKPDLAVTNAGSNTVTILLGKGDTMGTFTATSVSPSIAAGPTSMAVGDFNADGKLDIAVTSAGSGTANGTTTVLLGNSDGTFTPGTSQSTGVGPQGIAAGNFNSSGITDLAVANLNVGNTTGAGTLTVLLSQVTQTATATATGISPAGSGSHLVDASYPGNSAYAGSVSATTSLGAQAGATTLVLVANPTSITFGQQALLSATLSPYNGAGNTTNGETITFYNGANSIGTGTLTSGVATLNVTSLPVGQDSLTAKYLGDANFSASTSSATTLAVAAAIPLVSLAPGSLTFMSQAIGSTSAAQNITLSNTGLGVLTITSIVASAGFGQTNTCGSSVAPGTTCTIAVTFSPTTAGSQTGTLTVTDNASGSPQIVTLTGAGPTVTVSASSSSLNISAPGGSTTETIQIAAVAGFSGTVNLTCSVTYTGSGAANNAPTCSLNPSQVQVTAGTAATATLTVSSTAAIASEKSKSLWPSSGVAFAMLFLIGFLPRRRWNGSTILVVLILAATCAAVGCGGGNNAPTNPGTTIGSYQVGVTATSATVTSTTTTPLTLQ